MFILFLLRGDRTINSKEIDNEIQLSFHRIVMCLIKSIITVQSLTFHVGKKY